MSENLETSDIESVQVKLEPEQPESAGRMLKKARLDTGLHIAALAVSLRVPVKRIEALECDQLDQLPDVVFARALASSICNTLKVDPSPILDKLPKVASPRLNRDEIAINTPIGVSKTNNTNEAGVLSIFSTAWFLGVLLLCAGAAGIYFWPKSLISSVPEGAVTTKNLQEIGVSQAKEVQLTVDNMVVPNSTVGSSLGGSALGISDAATIATGIVAKSVSNVAVTTPEAKVVKTTSVPTNSIAPIVPTNGDKLITFKATGQTWVEVKKTSGATVFKKLLNDGETASASGNTPWLVIVGRADVTQVEVRGKPVDLALISKNNIARFEVN